MNYATGAAFNIDDMFINFPYEKLDLTCKEAQKINKDPHKDKLVKKIFRTCFKKVIDDIIDKNIIFKLPVNDSELKMRRISNEQFSKARKNGKFRDVDFLESYFSGYELELNVYKRGGLKRSKNVYVDPKRKQRITDNTNKGKQYG